LFFLARLIRVGPMLSKVLSNLQLSIVSVLLLAVTVSTLRVLQVSDFHLDVDYNRKGDPQKMCHISSPSRASRLDANADLGSYGDYMCDSPESLVRFAIDETVRVSNGDGKLDLVLWTGDNTPHIDGYDENYVVNAITKTTSIIKSVFPNTPVLPTFGNHDYSPANAFDSNVTLYERSFELWSDVILGADNEQFFKSGGFYYYDYKGARILVLNTNLYYNVNNAYGDFADQTDPAGQFKFMEDTLEQATKCTDAKKCFSTVHIVTHIAPGVFERSPNFQWYRPEYNKRFLDITQKYASHIGWMIFGHHHTDTFHVVRDDSGAPVQTMLMAPSVTPWFSSLPGAGSNNPAFRLFDTYDIDKRHAYREITTYAIDLSRLNAGKQPEFAPLYSHTLEYQMPGLTPQDFDDLINRMLKDDNLFYKYIANNAVLVDLNMPVEPYRSAQFCSMQHADFDKYDDCMKSSFALYTIIPTVVILFSRLFL
ncbi:hypothetical protein PENTCL1PPCAC_2898, partial [Pristionchus entomophagus]